MDRTHSRPVLLVGSVPLPAATDVFTSIAGCLGPRCSCMPDGETGERLGFVGWQWDRLSTAPGVAVEQKLVVGDEKKRTFTRLRLDGDPDQIDLGPLGYVAAAAQSYADFVRLRDAGSITPGTRLQIAIPTPLMLAAGFVGDAGKVQQVCERAMAAEIKTLFDTIPAKDVVLQWDVAAETEREEAHRHPGRARQFMQIMGPDWDFAAALAGIARACDWVPAEAGLGIHLCYGDPDGKHIIEPEDAQVMTEIANSLAANVRRTIDYIHMPVPIERDDDAYFTPLKALQVADATQIYLGLIHQKDGVEGARRRMKAADRVISGYGVATECGLGRLPPNTIQDVLKLHRDVSDMAMA